MRSERRTIVLKPPVYHLILGGPLGVAAMTKPEWFLQREGFRLCRICERHSEEMS